MRIEDVEIPTWLKSNLRSSGVEVLYPPQVEAVKRGLLQGENLVVATPTASGKTLIAILASQRHVELGRRVLYLTPLKALTSEKYVELKQVFSGSMRPVRIAAASSDYDDPGYWIRGIDIVVATYEKADSLIRHGVDWLEDVGLLVVDETHMIGDVDRGPALEMTIAKILEVRNDVQVLCLSATMKNVEELADWLGASPIVSDFRPVPLIEGVMRGDRIILSDGSVKRIRQSSNPLVSVVLEGILEGGQVLVFGLTRRKAEGYAARLAEEGVTARLARGQLEKLKEYATLVSEAEQESPFSEKLSYLISRGVAFHHAGLGYQHRRIIEEAFRSRALPILTATPTLAAGVNLPARVVVIPELRRYDARLGMKTLSVMEYKQLCGRAGRPRYDDVGYSITIARSREEEEILIHRYISGKPERIISALGSERHLRSQILSLIAGGLASSKESLRRFIGKTFYAYQLGLYAVEEKLYSVLNFLEEHGMISADEGLRATRLGARVSELYIDPLSAVKILEVTRMDDDLMDCDMLRVICSTPDLADLRVARIREGVIERYIEERMGRSALARPDPLEEPELYEVYLNVMRNVAVLNEWINETPERELYEKLNVEPGDFAVLRERAEWLSYAASQITAIAGKKKHSEAFSQLTERIRHGVKPELLQLVSLPDIGRVRGRSLWRSGYRSLEDIKKASVDELATVQGIGQRIAEGIKRYLEGIIGGGT